MAEKAKQDEKVKVLKEEDVHPYDTLSPEEEAKIRELSGETREAETEQNAEEAEETQETTNAEAKEGGEEAEAKKKTLTSKEYKDLLDQSFGKKETKADGFVS